MDYLTVKDTNKRLNADEARRNAVHLRSRPINFAFDIYGPCNLRCVHCGFHKEGRTSEQEVSDRVYDEVVRELMPAAYVCHLGGTNWGEMTISKNFHRFLLDCRKYSVRVNLTTNGTRMNDDWFTDLVDALDVAGFSMEGMEQEFERIRGFPWRRFVANIEKLVQGRRERGKEFRIEWRYCAHADSIHQLPDMIRCAKRIGVDRIQVMPLVPYVREQRFKNLAYHRSAANHFFGLARAVARELDFSINIPQDYSSGEFDQALLKLKTRTQVEKETVPVKAAEPVELVRCYRPWQTCVINELGSVKPSGIYWRPMGNLAERGFEAVWNGRRYRRLRRSINSRRPHSICYDCRLPSFEAEQGRIAGELRPSAKQWFGHLGRSLVQPRRVTFDRVLDEELDPATLTAETVTV